MSFFQRVATSNLIEVSNGVPYQPLHVPQALAPSTGSVLYSPPNVSRIVGIDFQTTTYMLTAGAGAYTNVTWPAVGFGGALSSQRRYYNTGIAPPLTSTIAQGPMPLVAGQSTQLCLMCNVQIYSSTTALMLGTVNLATLANSTDTPKSALTGPWFSTGLTYTGFSCVASTMVYTPTSVSALPVSLGITATLYVVFTQN
jgi:hypothetical protein